MKLVYLATPYSHHDPATRDLRATKAADAALALMAKHGVVVYSPIAAWHPWCVTRNLPFTYEHWRDQDQAFIERSDEVWILMLDGWDQSNGVAEERNTALLEQMTIKYVEPDTLEVFNLPPMAE